SALNAIDAHSESTAMIGDRMDTDVVSGLEAGLKTILVLTGVSTRESAERFPYRASRIVDSEAALLDEGPHSVRSGPAGQALALAAPRQGPPAAGAVLVAQGVSRRYV